MVLGNRSEPEESGTSPLRMKTSIPTPRSDYQTKNKFTLQYRDQKTVPSNKTSNKLSETAALCSRTYPRKVGSRKTTADEESKTRNVKPRLSEDRKSTSSRSSVKSTTTENYLHATKKILEESLGLRTTGSVKKPEVPTESRRNLNVTAVSIGNHCGKRSTNGECNKTDKNSAYVNCDKSHVEAKSNVLKNYPAIPLGDSVNESDSVCSSVSKQSVITLPSKAGENDKNETPNLLHNSNISSIRDEDHHDTPRKISHLQRESVESLIQKEIKETIGVNDSALNSDTKIKDESDERNAHDQMIIIPGNNHLRSSATTTANHVHQISPVAQILSAKVSESSENAIPASAEPPEKISDTDKTAETAKVSNENQANQIRPSLEAVKFDSFKRYNNVAFIGIEEDNMSSLRHQLIMYQPPEEQLLLYDSANCAATLAYLRICGLKPTVEYKKNAEHMSPSGRVPFIRCGNCIVSEFEAIVAFVKSRGIYCHDVPESEVPTMRAFIAMINGILDNAERYICWYDEATVREHSAPRSTNHYPFPLNYILAWRKQAEERRRLTAQGRSWKILEEMVMEVRECCNHLSQKLGKHPFFFGKKFCELDALVYGHVYALCSMKLPGQAEELNKIILKFPNLLSLAETLDQVYGFDKFSKLSVPQAKKAKFPLLLKARF